LANLTEQQNNLHIPSASGLLMNHDQQ